MSNKLPPMNKVVDFNESQKQKQQLELQRQSFIVNTRMRLAETFLNTMIGRLDVDLTADGEGDALIDASIDYANGLMTKLGIVLPVTNVE